MNLDTIYVPLILETLICISFSVIQLYYLFSVYKTQCVTIAIYCGRDNTIKYTLEFKGATLWS